MINSDDRHGGNCPQTPLANPAWNLRKPYHAPACRSLGDMRRVTLKSGGLPDGSMANPSRP
jgi:hypothetical protein